MNLVCRFYEPTQGQVLIDGRDARERSQPWLHANIGFVLQTPHLFSGTVLENLRYGKPDATMQEIEAAVKAVCADEIIARSAGRAMTHRWERRQQPVYGRKAAFCRLPVRFGRPENFGVG